MADDREAPEATANAEPEARPTGAARFKAELVRQLRRPLVGLALALFAITVLFPKVGPKDLTVTTLLPIARCAKDLTLTLYQGETLARRHTEALAGGSEVTTVLNLPKGEYRLQVELGCGDRVPAGTTGTHEETVVLEESRTVEIDLSSECPCGKR